MAGRAVLYGRVSTARQHERGHGLLAQQDALAVYAEREGLDVVEVVLDGGESGSSMQRPGWLRVMELVRAGEVDVVAATRSDRVARSLLHLLRLVDELPSGVRLVFCEEDFDTADRRGSAWFVLQVRGAAAEMERSLAAARTREALAAARDRGVRLGRPRVGWSVVDGRLVPNGRHEVVRRAHGLREQGMRLVDVAAVLNDEGWVTGSGRGRWHPSSVSRLLASPVTAAA